MSLSTLPLSYCTNVHPAQRLDEVLRGIADYTAPMRDRCGRAVAAGLWLAKPVIDELTSPTEGTIPSLTGRVGELRETLQARGLSCYTLNTFPYGNFHSDRVKDQVYIPDWSTPERAAYTIACARVLSELLPEGCDGSLSTLPLGFKSHPHGTDFQERCIDRLIAVAAALDELHDETGRCIRLAIEPEPFCVLETTPETLEFFAKLNRRAEEVGRKDITRRHLGVCYDVCHQAVEFEDIGASVGSLQKAGIRINKLHITCAVHVPNPADVEVRRELAAFVEPRYLHQTMARTKQNIVLRRVDLDPGLCESPPTSFRDAAAWRVHFHVPVHRAEIGRLGTTQADLKAALRAVASLDYAPHLEVETYTWAVLPGGGSLPLVEGLAAEMQATYAWIDELRGVTS
jgi:sugar phosphate isomerase/epimerase